MPNRIKPPVGNLTCTPDPAIYPLRAPYVCGLVGPLLERNEPDGGVTYVWFSDDLLYRFRHPDSDPVIPTWFYRIFYDDGTYEVYSGIVLYERGTWAHNP